MAGPMLLSNIQSRAAGVQAELSRTWQYRFPVFEKQQNALIRQLPYTNLRNAPYVWKEVAPTVVPWPYGTTRTHQSFQDRKIELDIFPYNLSIPWSQWDEEDDQVGDFRPSVQKCVDRYLQLPDRLFTEYLNGTASLNPEIKLAYDGAAMFSATNGDGAARFGATGGNIINGSGFTPADVLHDVAIAQQRFLNFKDPANEILFGEDGVEYKDMLCIIPQSLNEIFQAATQSEFLRRDTMNATSESNYLKGTFEFRINNRLTDQNDWYIVLENHDWKPMIYRSPKDIRSIIADYNNSDHARETNEYVFYSDVRVGMGLWCPFVIIKVNL